jgi:hypothetical protein
MWWFVCQWLGPGQWFSLGTLVSSANKTNRHDITEILLKMVLNTITLTLEMLSRQTNHHIILYWVHSTWVGFELATFVVIGTDCLGSCKSNYHKITTTMAPSLILMTWPVQLGHNNSQIRSQWQSN